MSYATVAPIFGVLALLIVGFEESGRYSEAAGIAFVATAVAMAANVLPGSMSWRLVEQWAAGERVDRYEALASTYTFGRTAVVRSTVALALVGGTTSVAVGAVAGASTSMLIQLGVLGAAAMTAVALIAIHTFVEAFLRPPRVAIAADSAFGDALPRSRPSFATWSTVAILATAWAFTASGAAFAVVIDGAGDDPAFAVIIATGLTLFFAVPITVGTAASPSFQPIRDLAEGIERVARGDYSQRLPVVQDDDLGALVASFNRMQAGLGCVLRSGRRTEFSGQCAGQCLEPSGSRADACGQRTRRGQRHRSRVGRALAPTAIAPSDVRSVRASELGRGAHEPEDRVKIRLGTAGEGPTFASMYSDEDTAALYDVLNPWSRSDDFYLDLVMDSDAAVDIGCGTGVLLRRARERGHRGRLCGVDPDGAALARAKRRVDVEWVQCPAAEMPWDAAFQLATMTGHAFQSLVTDDDVRASLAAIRRVLTVGGRFAFETRNPLAREWEEWHRGPPMEVMDPSGRRVRVSYIVESVIGEVVTLSETTADVDGTVLRVDRGSLRFAAVDAIVVSLEEAHFTVEDQFGGWGHEPLTTGSAEIITTAVAR